MERTKVRSAALLALVAALALPSRALADAVPPAPTSCPAGTHGITGHAGTGCAPDHCPVTGSVGGVCAGGRPCCLIEVCNARDRNPCGPGQECVEVRACVAPGVIRTPGSGRSFREAVSHVNEDKGCLTPGSTQEIVGTCMAKSSTSVSAPGRRRGPICSVDLDGTGDCPALPLAGAAMVCLGAWARRRKPRC